MIQLLLTSINNSHGLTTDFLRAAAGVVGQADDHLSHTMAHWRRHFGAVVLHWDNGLVVTAVHTTGITRGFPHLTMCMRNARAISAGCRHTHRAMISYSLIHITDSFTYSMRHNLMQMGIFDYSGGPDRNKLLVLLQVLTLIKDQKQ